MSQERSLPAPERPVELLRGRFVMDADALDLIYPAPVRAQISELVCIVGEPVTADMVESDPSLLADTEVIFSGWRAPRLTGRLLEGAPKLRAVFYGAGATDYFLTEASQERGVVVTSAVAINAVPVAEYTVAQVVMCLKRVWQHALAAREQRAWRQQAPGATGYHSRIGLVSLGEIGMRVADRLAAMDLEVLAYDVRPNPAAAERHGVRYISLHELFATCDVVSLHTPLQPDTRHMIGPGLLGSMKHGASLINTARGGLIDHAALAQVLAEREDLFAVLDVVDPEPLPADDALWGLPNVVMTPHIAGSRGRECERMGLFMVEEARRYLSGEALMGRVVPPG